MSEEEIIEIIQDNIDYRLSDLCEYDEKQEAQAEQGLLDLYQKEKEKNIELDEKFKYAVPDEIVAEKYISKDKIRDKQIEREFELQQEYKDFEDDIQWKTYKELLEEE